MFTLYRFLVHLCIPGATECLLEFYYLHLFGGEFQQLLPYLVAPHRANWGLIHLNFIREIYLNQYFNSINMVIYFFYTINSLDSFLFSVANGVYVFFHIFHFDFMPNVSVRFVWFHFNVL